MIKIWYIQIMFEETQAQVWESIKSLSELLELAKFPIFKSVLLPLEYVIS